MPFDNAFNLSGLLGAQRINGPVAESAAETMSNVDELVRQRSPGEQRQFLERLYGDARKLIETLPEHMQTSVARDLKMMVEALLGSPPNRRWFTASSEGLIEAANSMPGIAEELRVVTEQLGRLFLDR